MQADLSPDLTGQAILVTGAGKGLGRAIARRLASRGAVVGLADVDENACQEACSAIVADGGRASAYIVDVSDRLRFFEAAREFSELNQGRIDAVINNAAVLVYAAVEDINPETLDRLLGAGFKSVVWGAQVLLQHMDSAKGGSLVNFSSPVAFKGYSRSLAYSAVKGAVTSATRVLAQELGPRNIRVNAIVPGSIPTPGAAEYVSQAEYERRAQTQIPLRRLGSEEDVAQAVAFLVSSQARFVNGAFLAVDGGLLAAG
jgi:NAD(P)-dependent dehydrogenase (short-subunit alcohol dehydrogenase family)